MSASPLSRPAGAVRSVIERLSPRQKQYAMLCAILVGGVGLLTIVFTLSDDGPKVKNTKPSSANPTRVTNIGVMSPGQQVNPVDQWVGTAGSKLAQYESERDEQTRLNKDRLAFENRTMQRFSELEQRLLSANHTPPPAVAASGPTSAMPSASSLPLAPANSPPLPPPVPMTYRAPPFQQTGAMPPGLPPTPLPPVPAPGPALTRVIVADRKPSASSEPKPVEGNSAPEFRTVSTFLPVSFTRGTLLGGLDAPTGGQSQANPHPVLIRLSENTVLPNRFRAAYRDCFVIAAGYGDISSERAYLRTESLSCVRSDGATLEVRIQGSIYGEDGKVGMRGRLVTKQGQMLANALLAGIVSGIGQGVATSTSNVSTSALGSIATTNGTDAYRTGLGTGVGRALDRLAQYYIKLAENTFPVIEIDAGREIDVVITRGVKVDPSMSTNQAAEERVRARPVARYLEPSDDETF
ncbi:TrbI/VirB10 family protein [Piscinibacter sakaiensis]|uniref:TrbI/VirB10 family protein n=1 Tax=Piscinibacter sakaiensis TaxID=1547922 RepID=UPI003AACF09C